MTNDWGLTPLSLSSGSIPWTLRPCGHYAPADQYCGICINDKFMPTTYTICGRGHLRKSFDTTPCATCAEEDAEKAHALREAEQHPQGRNMWPKASVTLHIGVSRIADLTDKEIATLRRNLARIERDVLG